MKAEYTLVIAYDLTEQTPDQVDKLIRRKRITMIRVPMGAKHFYTFKQNRALVKALGRVRESGKKFRYKTIKIIDDGTKQSVLNLSNCAKI